MKHKMLISQEAKSKVPYHFGLMKHVLKNDCCPNTLLKVFKCLDNFFTHYVQKRKHLYAIKKKN